VLPAARICSWDSAVLSSSSPALHSCCCLDTADESAKCLCPRAPLNGFVRSHRTRGSAAGGLTELRRNLFWLQCTPYTSSNPHAWSTRSKSMGRSRVAPVSTASLMHWLHETGATTRTGGARHQDSRMRACDCHVHTHCHGTRTAACASHGQPGNPRARDRAR